VPNFEKGRKEDPRNYHLSASPLCLEQILLAALLRHMENREVV